MNFKLIRKTPLVVLKFLFGTFWNQVFLSNSWNTIILNEKHIRVTSYTFLILNFILRSTTTWKSEIFLYTLPSVIRLICQTLESGSIVWSEITDRYNVKMSCARWAIHHQVISLGAESHFSLPQPRRCVHWKSRLL